MNLWKIGKLVLLFVFGNIFFLSICSCSSSRSAYPPDKAKKTPMHDTINGAQSDPMNTIPLPAP